MFLRTKTTPNSPRRSVQIVENRRDSKTGKTKQKILQHVGIAMNEDEEKKLKDLAKDMIAKMEAELIAGSDQQDFFAETAPEDVQEGKKRGRPRQKKLEEIVAPQSAADIKLGEIVEEKRLIEGIHEVGGHVFDGLYLGLGERKSLGYRDYHRLRDLVLARIVNPTSKYKAQQELAKHFDREHSLDGLYAMMDKVHAEINTIKTMTFEKTKSLFPDGVDLLLFDVTTLYFESTDTDEMRRFGYSKDCRFNTTQVVLALATNKEGLPIGYELFHGKTAEVKTLIAAIESWKKLFDIGSVCFIGDRAMMSDDNVMLLEASGYHYVIAAKLKLMSKEMKDKILDLAQYDKLKDQNVKKPKEDDTLLIKEFDYTGRRLIVSHTNSRAAKDQKEREALIEKLEKNLGEKKKGKAKKLVTNKGVSKFIKMNDSIAMIDEEKIAEDARWDGLHGVISNIPEEEASRLELLRRYASLWRIEESFRINKHTLKMRPIFHWKPERIQAHVAICYMAFSVLRHLEYQANLVQKIPVNKIIEELLGVQASIYIHKTKKERYRMPGVFSVDARKIYRAFNLERSIDAVVYS